MQGSEFLKSVNPITFKANSLDAFKVFTNPHAHGTENFFKLANDGVMEIVYTDGVRDLFKSKSCYWFRDIISSYSSKIFASGEDFFSLFILKNPNSESEALFLATDGNTKVLIKQEIPYTDLDLNIHLFLEFDGCARYTLMLPSER